MGTLLPHQIFLSFVLAGMTAGAVTTLLLGLPGLMALSGASFADRVSHTTTRYLA